MPIPPPWEDVIKLPLVLEQETVTCPNVTNEDMEKKYCPLPIWCQARPNLLWPLHSEPFKNARKNNKYPTTIADVLINSNRYGTQDPNLEEKGQTKEKAQQARKTNHSPTVYKKMKKNRVD